MVRRSQPGGYWPLTGWCGKVISSPTLPRLTAAITLKPGWWISRRRPKGRAAGGLDIVNTPTQFTAGEAGPEMAMFIPLNRQIQAPVAQTINHTGDFSHNIDAAISSSVAGLDGHITAVIRKALAEVLR